MQKSFDVSLFQMGYMEVVIPPDIMDDESADGMVTHEGGNIRLRCVATGSPKPTVTWKREDGRNIILREDGQKHCKCISEDLSAISYLRDYPK